LYEPSIRDRLDGDRLLNEPEKQFATMLGSATVEAKGELVQVVVQMRVADGALMSAKQPSFEQRDHAVNARQQFGGEFVVSAKERDPMVVPDLDPVVPVPAIGVHFAARLDRFVDELLQTLGAPIGNSSHPDSTNPSPDSSAATTMSAFCAVERPRAPPSPPISVSSTSTRPNSRSRRGLTMARRSLCSHVHAV
jgi:hypothetical protein